MISTYRQLEMLRRCWRKWTGPKNHMFDLLNLSYTEHFSGKCLACRTVNGQGLSNDTRTSRSSGVFLALSLPRSMDQLARRTSAPRNQRSRSVVQSTAFERLTQEPLSKRWYSSYTQNDRTLRAFPHDSSEATRGHLAHHRDRAPELLSSLF